MNLSQQKRERMIGFLKQLEMQMKEDQEKVNDNDSLIAINEIKNELISRKYGLMWEQHEERVDVLLKDHIPVFTEVKDKEILADEGGPCNFLLEGDNLHSLKLLEKTLAGGIDLIYIDPPYNTGNEDFIYDDRYVVEEDGYRHSKWLSFMAERLKIARRLLSSEGVIFIQISDIELAQLKLLCDSVFGEENFLNYLSVNMKNIAGASGGGEDKRFKKNCEYLLVYAKQYDMLPLFNGAYEYTEIADLLKYYKDNGISWKYTSVLVDEGSKVYAGSTTDGDGNEIRIYIRKGAVIKSIRQVAQDKGITEAEAYRKYGTKVFRTTNAQSSIRTRIMNYRSGEKLDSDLLSIEYIPRTGKYRGQVYEQFYKGESCALFVWLKDTAEERDGLLYKKDLKGTFWDATAGTKNLTKEGNVEFSNGKKPIALIKQIISLYPRSDATILDFFAGSGSTGHAVISLNKEDGGSRSFILCSNNEVRNSLRDNYLLEHHYVNKRNEISEYVKTEAFQQIAEREDYQSLGLVRSKTYPRLYNVIYGYVTDSGRQVEGLSANLKYYRTQFVEKYSQDEEYSVSDELLGYVQELIQLEYGTAIEHGNYMMILSDEDADALEAQSGKMECCKGIYISGQTLLTASQERLFGDIGMKPVPEYYFEEELKEVGELW